MGNVKKLMGDKVTCAVDQYEALRSADALLIVTEWSLFRTPHFDMMDNLLKNKVIFDGRNLYDLEKMIDAGYYYNSIGRKRSSYTEQEDNVMELEESSVY